jgi:hypothetical protein
VGDWTREGQTYGNIGTGHMYLKDYDKAVDSFEAQHAMATSMKLAHVQSHAGINMGVSEYPRVTIWHKKHYKPKP